MEEKGIKSSGGDNHGPPAAASASSGGVDDSKAKPKMMDKVKEKLHIHKH